MTFPVLVDEQQQYGRAYEGIGLPTSVIVGRDGHVVRGIDGAMTLEQMRAAVAPALARSAPQRRRRSGHVSARIAALAVAAIVIALVAAQDLVSADAAVPHLAVRARAGDRARRHRSRTRTARGAAPTASRGKRLLARDGRRS